MIEFYIAALMTGLIGSLHCLGMCGPIVVSLPLSNESWWKKISGSILYNLGRAITYGIMGALFGLLGKGLQLAGLQLWASIFIGIAMIASVIMPRFFKNDFDFDKLFAGPVARLIGSFRKLFEKSSLSGLLTIGLLNGLLPCGLVYVALAGAINTNSVLGGSIYMIIFGLATAPALLGLSLIGNLIQGSLRKKLSKLVPIFIVVLGVLFILRGLSLGIPYISPKQQKLEIREQMEMNPGDNSKTKSACCSSSD